MIDPTTLRIHVQEDESGGCWAEVSALPGCATQGATIPELMDQVPEAVEGWLLAGEAEMDEGLVYEIAV
jgi:predicted RNase H-like HicB family nuclease